MPAAWAALMHQRCGCPKRLTWAAWQALASSRWSEAKALRQQFLLFHLCPETGDALFRHGVTPAKMIYVLEALRREGLLSPAEAASLEEAILTQTTQSGAWKETRYGEDRQHPTPQCPQPGHWPPRT